MSAREDASPIDEYPWRNLPTKLRSDIPRRKRIPHFSISATPVADHTEVVVLPAPAPVQSSSSTSCLQSQITSLDYSNNHLSSFRSLTRKQPELGSAVDHAPDAKRLRREVVSETGSCLESVSETNAPVQIADSDEDCDEELSDSSDWWFLSEDDITDSSQEDAVPSEMYAFFLQFTRQFIPFDNGRTKSKAPAVGSQDSKSEELRARSFEEEGDEESYTRLRSREKREMQIESVFDYTKGSHEHRHLLLDQRHLMVNWMIERFKATEMQLETLFLAVSIIDRFLSRGYFKSVRCLQLLGIASITLATRIEENQPYNCILQTKYSVEKNIYSRNEVVAMEWLVQEILDFKCFVPNVHNFMWFYLKAAKADEVVDELARYLAVVVLLDHERLSFKASTLAASLVILACLAADHEESSHVVIETHVRTRNDDLPECLKSLEWLIKHAGLE
ncbi:cyclin-SDS-like isoform X2 [Carex rostrata]